MATYQELMAQKADLERQAAALAEQIETARQQERESVLQQIRSLMAEHGVTLAELGTGRGKTPRVGKAAKSASTGRKVAPKYRDAATGDTWSGRGLQPNWLKAALASGRKLEEFAL
jgi:DNA-binding protein H-NS